MDNIHQADDTEWWLGCSYTTAKTQREHSGGAFKRQGGLSKMTWVYRKPVGERRRLPGETRLCLGREGVGEGDWETDLPSSCSLHPSSYLGM